MDANGWTSGAPEWDLLGERDVAHYLSVAPPRVRTWRIRGLLPEPDGVVLGVPVWTRRTIRSWAEKTGHLAPLLRDHVLWLLRVRGDADSGEVTEHCRSEHLLAGESAPDIVRAVLLDLEGEGFIRHVEGRDAFSALPEGDAETLDDRCLEMAGAGGQQTEFGADEITTALGLEPRDHIRVAAALRRLAEAGLLFPASEDRYAGQTPAGARWLAFPEEREFVGSVIGRRLQGQSSTPR